MKQLSTDKQTKEDAVLRTLLATPPKPHKDSKARPKERQPK